MVLLILFPTPHPASSHIPLLHRLWISTPLTQDTSIVSASLKKLGARVTKADDILMEKPSWQSLLTWCLSCENRNVFAGLNVYLNILCA